MTSLIKIDLEGNVLSPTDYDIDRAGIVIHSAIQLKDLASGCPVQLVAEAARKRTSAIGAPAFETHADLGWAAHLRWLDRRGSDYQG